MTDAVIVDAVRTAVGKRGGALREYHPVQLGSHVLKSIAERNQLDPALIDDVIFGCVMQAGEQAINIARWSVLGAGWPESVPGVTVDRACGSSQQAIMFAAASIVAGHADVVVAGGVESMTRVPMGSTEINGPGKPIGPDVERRYGTASFNQGLGAELIAERWGFDRAYLDQLSVESHRRAHEAIENGYFADHIIPLTGLTKEGDEFTFDRDEGIRPHSTVEALSGLSPAFREGGVITAGNSSQISDGASALLLMSEARAEKLGVTPIARVHASAVGGADPITMLTGPIPATRKVLEKASVGLDDIGIFEVNEAFAPVPAAWMTEFGVSSDRVNPYGGAIAFGHPLGASGGRIMGDLLHHMRRTGTRYGLQTMCESGGLANATILELIG